MRNEVNFNVDILTWAISRAGFELHTFAEKFPKLQERLVGEKKPTGKKGAI